MTQREWIDKDYYRDLGISSTATAEDIKKTYRNIARDNHPDRNPGDSTAEERFKAASEAYSVLSDKDKRAEYDELKRMVANGSLGANLGGGYTHDFSGFTGGFSNGFAGGFGGSRGSAGGFSDIFSNLFSDAQGTGYPGSPYGGGYFGNTQPRRRHAPRGADVETEITLEFREATKGVTVPIRLSKPDPCEPCHGSGEISGSASKTDSSDSGSNSSSSGHRACENCHGTGRVTQARTITVRVPAGVVDGQKVRLAGQGSAGERGKPAGDLFVTVHVLEDKVFSRSGDDLLITVPVSYTELVLGGTITVPTLNNKVRVKIPQGTAHGTTLRVRGHGVQKRNSSSGDLLVTVHVEVPKNLDEGAMSTLRKYAEEEKRSGFDPRANWEGRA